MVSRVPSVSKTLKQLRNHVQSIAPDKDKNPNYGKTELTWRLESIVGVGAFDLNECELRWFVNFVDRFTLK